MPGPLDPVNCWLLGDVDGVALVDTGPDIADTRAAWATLFGATFADRDGVRWWSSL